MKVLLSLRHSGLVRNFEDVLCLLAERGHDVRVVSDHHGTAGDHDLMRELAAKHPSLAFGPGPCHKLAAPRSEPFVWSALAHRTRAALDYLHYLQPAYDQAPGLRGRLEKRTPASVVRATRLPLVRSTNGIRVLRAVLRTVERAIPWNREVVPFLARHQPQVVLVSPLIWFGSPQVDYVRGARALGMRTALCVGSWDNLTTKGSIYELPDLVTVWNETQENEVVMLHGAPAARVVVTGAHVYDHWFTWRASPRQEFCDRAGLASDRPFLLYVCSSRSVAPDEAAFVKTWIARVRAADRPALRQAGILVRPHPENPQPWHEADAFGRDNVVVWPRRGTSPMAQGAKVDYFDSLFHSAAVIGVNTSAFIEAGIVGRPVYSLLAPEFASAQERTIHFHYLVTGNGGIVRVSRDFETHLDQLASVLSAGSADEPINNAFIRTFVRPHGADLPSAPCLVAAIERLGQDTQPRPARRRLWIQAIRPALFPLAVRSAAAAFVASQRANGKNISLAGAYRRVLFHPTAGRFPLPRVRAAGARVLDTVFAFSAIRNFTRRHLAPRAMPELKEATGVNTALHGTRQAASADADARQHVQSALAHLVDGDAPILVGPFLGEVGFELLYWIPFLRWAREFAGLDRARLIAVSRGGAAAWYQGLCGSYQDVFEYYSPEESYRRHVEQAGPSQKQKEVGAFDQEIIERVQRSRRLTDVRTLHPSLMYQLFAPFWRKQASIGLVESMTTYQVLRPMGTAGVDGLLPDDYIAVKFYGNESFPNVSANRAMAEEIVGGLIERTNVILLDTGLRVDDHLAFAVAGGERVARIDHLCTPGNNLALQTQIISRARAFVGTCGGFSYLAALCGVDAVALYSHPELFRAHHLDVAWRVFRSLKGGAFMPLDTHHVAVLRDVLKGLDRRKAQDCRR